MKKLFVSFLFPVSIFFWSLFFSPLNASIAGLFDQEISKLIPLSTVRIISHKDDETRATVGTGFFYIDYTKGPFKNFLPLDSKQKMEKLLYFDRFFPAPGLEEVLRSLVVINSDHLFIVTNKHVLLGKNKNDPKKSDLLTFSFNFKNNEETLNQELDFECIEGQNTFYHPSTDIAAIDISDFIKIKEQELKSQLFYTAFSHHNIGLNVLDPFVYPTNKLFMTGYPRGLYDKANNLPLTRGGTVASSSKYDWNNQPEFMIDMACFPGSSGSPVFRIIKDEYNAFSNMTSQKHKRISFLGIFKGGPSFKISKNPIVKTPLGVGRVIKAEQVKSLMELSKGGYKEYDLSSFAGEREAFDYALDSIEED